MCGIIGYIGKKTTIDILLDSLELLEYRGYDSAGVALFADPDKGPVVKKVAGRVSALRAICQDLPEDPCAGIGHTRWATHGGVSDANAHPHQQGRVTLVHNGIIENYKELIKEYNLKDRLVSETDTEVAAAVLDSLYDGDPEKALRDLVSVLKGTFAFAVLFSDKPGNIYAIRNVSPIVVAMTEHGALLASDVAALGVHAREYAFLPEYQVACLSSKGIIVHDEKRREVPLQLMEIDWDTSRGGKDGYPFYMEKEIHEQPDAIRNTIEPHIINGTTSFADEQIPDSLFRENQNIIVIACGTAMHAGLIGQQLFHTLANIHTDVAMASEFTYTNPVIKPGTLVIAVSQSGETIDTLEAIKYAKKRGAKVLSIVNVKGSTIADNSDYCIYTHAGPEIAVASTKAFTSQASVFYLLAIHAARLNGLLTQAEVAAYLEGLNSIPEVIGRILDQKDFIKNMTRSLLSSDQCFMIGRGLDYSLLLEGSLKLKEISYIHSEAYASGELKHGTIALITDGIPVVALVTQKALASKEYSNIREVQSRGGNVLLITKQSLYKDMNIAEEDTFLLPEIDDMFMPFPAAVVMQLIAYFTSAAKGYDVDKPRNLAKVVTVE
ncbi:MULTISPECIES: glutamine--fructose-6-phosphate transaminase (isomerizing) [unclassified Butyrivibrio]|uniref:glutamine--fructose-6-phosphate transaminase (isomerizing) n=1 Tax=unclassified Butyrivibrio TaxID=2639466 RepID=UPI0003B58C91|nr:MULTISPECIES: glutamine--fructose-6-phosphate transaminase (isomerizing) [unclassified Butyrivibrio]MDC7294311.1 glutamine--fructose-6-phosphate transaminase (isomerizing) [Butyrivibrio sp. DSM 10294]